VVGLKRGAQAVGRDNRKRAFVIGFHFLQPNTVLDEEIDAVDEGSEPESNSILNRAEVCISQDFKIRTFSSGSDGLAQTRREGYTKPAIDRPSQRQFGEAG
jgi:hypothetical protein